MYLMAFGLDCMSDWKNCSISERTGIAISNHPDLFLNMMNR
jgi:hypothetical protein